MIEYVDMSFKTQACVHYTFHQFLDDKLQLNESALVGIVNSDLVFGLFGGFIDKKQKKDETTSVHLLKATSLSSVQLSLSAPPGERNISPAEGGL